MAVTARHGHRPQPDRGESFGFLGRPTSVGVNRPRACPACAGLTPTRSDSPMTGLPYTTATEIQADRRFPPTEPLRLI
jgi:hypothetical protein